MIVLLMIMKMVGALTMHVIRRPEDKLASDRRRCAEPIDKRTRTNFHRPFLILNMERVTK
jgi:hypothetical protein